MIRAGIFTAPGAREQETLQATLASLAKAGITNIRLQLDGSAAGAMRTYDMLLWGLVANSEPDDHLMLLQDDMVCCGAMLEIAKDAIIRRPHAAHALFTPAQNVPDNREANGWVEVAPSWGLWGGQFLLPRALAADIAWHEFFKHHLASSRKQCDAATYETLRLLGAQTWTHVPSLFDHIGEVSIIGNAHSDETRGFRFNEWPR